MRTLSNILSEYLSEKTFNALCKMKDNFSKSRKPPRDLSKEYGWEEFFNDLLLGEGEVAIDFISVDGKPAKDHAIIFMLGKYGYEYKGGSCTELSPVPIPTKEGYVYRMPAKLYFQQVEPQKKE